MAIINGVQTNLNSIKTTQDLEAGDDIIAGDDLEVVGNITVGGTVDGRDIASDGSKLDNVEDNADVTDATNVAAAGAIMDSEYTAANEVMVGTGSGTHAQVTLAASQFLARKSTGNATNVTAAEARTILNVEDGATAGGGGTTHGTKTRAEMLALSPSAGDTCYCSTYKKIFLYNGETWGVDGETAQFTNKSGGALSEGDVVIIDTANNDSCDTIAGGYSIHVIGAVVIGGANNAEVVVAHNGIWDVDFNEAVSRGEFARTSANAGRGAADAAADAGMFAEVIETTGGAGLARCMLFSKEFY